MRVDLEIVGQLIKPKSRILDLGCGDGDLLYFAKTKKQATGFGLDNDANNIQTCLEKGVNVIEQDLDKGLADFDNQSFDLVIMTETLQAVSKPEKLMKEMLRVGKECIVTIPNFGQIFCRSNLFFSGTMPVAQHLPHNWYDTPNIHLCTLKDFEDLCRKLQVKILTRKLFDRRFRPNKFLKIAPNLFCSHAYYHLKR